MAGCTDCPRACAARGPDSYCGTSRPGRVFWRGVTLLEEHAISPTYEIYFTGCSLRCRFCTVPDALYAPDVGEWMPPEDLARDVADARHPPFNAVSLVGGDPTVNLPYVRDLVPALRRHVPTADLVLNTNLFVDLRHAPWLTDAFDWIVGDVHFWRPACAGPLAGSRDYPAAAVAAAEAFAAAGARLILRVLVLPGHLDCCAAPTVAWAAALPGDVQVHVMTHYAPTGRARGHAQLGRGLTDAEIAAARALLPPGARVPDAAPRPVRARLATAEDPAVPFEVGPDGRVLFPFVTGDLLPVVADLQPALRDRLSYLGTPADLALSTE